MNILHIIHFMNGGGSNKACYEVVKNDTENNHAFVCSEDGIAKEWFECISSVYTLDRDSHFNYPVVKIEDIINTHEIDVIHMYLPGMENPSFLDHIKKPKMITVLCDQIIGFNVDNFDHIHFISEYSKLINSENIGNAKNSVIRCGMQDVEKNPVRKNTDVVFGRISAICRTKKIIDTLICAKALPENKFIVGGHVLDETYNNFLKHFIHYNELKNVHFVNNVSEQQKDFIYSSIDVLHYPTSHENFCFSILEGMAKQKAVISYDDCSIPELNHENNLFIVENDNISKLIDATMMYTKDSKSRVEDAIKNRRVYETFYDTENYANSIKDIYESIGR